MSSALLIVPTLFLLDGSSSPSPLPAVAIAAADPSSASTSSPVDSGTAFAAATQASARAIWFEKAEVTDRARRFFNMVHLLAVAKADKEAAAAAQAAREARQRLLTASTTTTAPTPAPPAVLSGAAVVTTPGVVNATGSVNGYPCGGSLPSCCTLQHESGGNPTAQNPSSSASGLWQFMHDTWNNFDGYAEAKYAPAAVQNAKAVLVFAGGAGWGNWRGDGCYPGG